MSEMISNFINGESRPALDGATYDVIDPTTGQTYAQAHQARHEQHRGLSYWRFERTRTTPIPRFPSLLESPTRGVVDGQFVKTRS